MVNVFITLVKFFLFVTCFNVFHLYAALYIVSRSINAFYSGRGTILQTVISSSLSFIIVTVRTWKVINAPLTQHGNRRRQTVLPWWISLSIRQAVKFVLKPVESQSTQRPLLLLVFYARRQHTHRYKLLQLLLHLFNGLFPDNLGRPVSER